MLEEEPEEMEAESMTAVPSKVELAQMPGQQRQAVDSRAQDTEESTPDKIRDEQMPAGDQPLVVSQGQFQDADRAHRGSGTATTYQLPEGGHVLRFENFSVTNGPDLHVLLAHHPSPTGQADWGEYLDLGSLKGNVGSQNYEIPKGIDLAQFESVVIYCKPFHVVFSVAALGQST